MPIRYLPLVHERFLKEQADKLQRQVAKQQQHQQASRRPIEQKRRDVTVDKLSEDMIAQMKAILAAAPERKMQLGNLHKKLQQLHAWKGNSSSLWATHVPGVRTNKKRTLIWLVSAQISAANSDSTQALAAVVSD